MLERMYEEDEYSAGILRAFDESKEEFFGRLNARLLYIQERFRGPRFVYNSIQEWHPR